MLSPYFSFPTPPSYPHNTHHRPLSQSLIYSLSIYLPILDTIFKISPLCNCNHTWFNHHLAIPRPTTQASGNHYSTFNSYKFSFFRFQLWMRPCSICLTVPGFKCKVILKIRIHTHSRNGEFDILTTKEVFVGQ
jgi:hypothetical protein